MINTKLILVDEIPGTGKSTVAHFIARQLEKNGIKAKWFHEADNEHPLGVELKEKSEVNQDLYQDRLLVSYPEKLTEFVNNNSDLYYMRRDNNESKLFPISKTQLVMGGTYENLLDFKLENEKCQFVLNVKGQEPALFERRNS